LQFVKKWIFIYNLDNKKIKFLMNLYLKNIMFFQYEFSYSHHFFIIFYIMKLLELFCETKWIWKIFDKYDFETYSIDIIKKYNLQKSLIF